MQQSQIEWTDATWNPVTGCTKVSQGCKHCYAEKLYERFNGKGSFKNVQCHPDRLTQPLKIKKPSRIFVNSMSDLFHEDVPFEFINKVFSIMAKAQRHTFQVLTKRPERMLHYLKFECGHNGENVLDNLWPKVGKNDDYFTNFKWPLPNVWLGVSVEDQATADERIPLLLQTPAAVRFLSCEPLLGNVDINRDGKLIDWIIAGGESGPGARPMHPDWARNLRDQCNAAGVPFFFKQWGEYAPAHALQCNEPGIKGKIWHNFDPDTSVCKVGKKKAGRLLDGIEHNEFPEI